MSTRKSSSGCAGQLDILFVDDATNLCRTMQLWFGSKGYSVYTAESAAEAVQVATTKLPRIIITDLGLPDRSGYELLKTLRQSKVLRQTCFVAFSGATEEQEKNHALDAGFDYFIAKPPDFNELSELLQTCLRMRTDEESTVTS